MKKNLVLLGILTLAALAGVGLTAATGGFEKTQAEEDKFRIVTSFYPVYIATLNAAHGLEDVEVTNMTENKGGCLHDYQLTAADMKKLEDADVFIVNGAGMEMFMNSIKEAYPNLPVIDTSEGILLLESEGHDHGEEEGHDHDGEALEEHIHEEEEGHDHGEYNGHIWMNPDTYVMQIANIREGLSRFDAAHKSEYEANAQTYIEKVQEIGRELDELGAGHEEENIVLFHDSYAYLADKLHFHIVHQVVIEEDTSMSAGEMAEIMEEIRENHVSVLLAEKQYSDQIPTQIAKETGARVLIMDSLVSGEMDKDAYLNGMRENIRILKEELEN